MKLHRDLAEVPAAVREKLRAALAELLAEGAEPSSHALRVRASVAAKSAAIVARLHRAGLLPPLVAPWVEAPAPAAPAQEEAPGAQLAARIRAAKTELELAEVANEAAAQLPEGTLEPGVSRALCDLIREQRRCLADAARRPRDDSTAFLAATKEVVPLIEIFEAIESDERRARALEQATALLTRLLEEDQVDPDRGAMQLGESALR